MPIVETDESKHGQSKAFQKEFGEQACNLSDIPKSYTSDVFFKRNNVTALFKSVFRLIGGV